MPQNDSTNHRQPDTAAGAPETAFLSTRRLRVMLSKFSRLEMRLENCDQVAIRGHTLVPRQLLLMTIGRVAGLDIYISATK